MLEMQTASNGRWPQNNKSGISQQPLIRRSSNFKPKLRWPNQNWKCLKWRQPPMEDYLKILKVEYLSNHWLDLTQILNLSLGDHTKIEHCLKWRQHPMQEDLNRLKVEYHSNHWSDLLQILNFSLEDKTKIEWWLL